MATNTLSSRANLHDVLKLKAPNAKGALEVTNTLIEQNDLMQDLPSLPSNGGIFHQGVRVSTLPSGSLVNVGEYWAASKSERTPFVEALATVRDSWECPTDVLKTEGAEISQALVQDERANHIEGNGQAWCNLILEGPTTPTQNAIVGLMGRAPWNALDNEFCWGVGGTGTDLRSAWLICPGPSRVHLIHNPNHPTLGIEFEDKGESRETDPNDSTKHRWILTHEYMIQQGICIRDQRSVKRLANIQCAASDYTGADAVQYAIRAIHKHNINANKPWFMYCDADLYTQLVLATNDKLKVYTSDKNIYQTELPMIGPNIVIRRLDALNHASASGETVVT
jgi:hypothetical protein